VGLSSPLVVGATAYALPGGRTANLYAADVATGRLADGWPVSIADPAAPAAGAFISRRVAVSSPVALGGLIAQVVRFDYDLRADIDGQPGLHDLHEYLTAVDAQSARVAWQVELGRRQVSSTNEVPALALAPCACCPRRASHAGRRS
jgi:hypothetical protein